MKPVVMMYGIPNCDSIKKARAWLDSRGISCRFHNYKKEGVDAAQLSLWVERLGWEALLNKRGTTWRKLADEKKEGINRERAILLMCENPSMIKRPVLIVAETIEIGFSEQKYAGLFD
jgi:Spx/MgsR family transcriptional regulator